MKRFSLLSGEKEFSVRLLHPVVQPATRIDADPRAAWSLALEVSQARARNRTHAAGPDPARRPFDDALRRRTGLTVENAVPDAFALA